jgi:tRNA A37 threonylcarbamoyladenosine synthetase subunit TsaC/SUA5/YrdC
MMDLEEDGSPLYGALIEDYFGNKIDLIIDPGEYDFIGQSTTIIDFTTGAPELVRLGAGKADFIK